MLGVIHGQLHAFSATWQRVCCMCVPTVPLLGTVVYWHVLQMQNIWRVPLDLLWSVPTRLVWSVQPYHLVRPGSAPMRLFPGRPPRGCTLHTAGVPDGP